MADTPTPKPEPPSSRFWIAGLTVDDHVLIRWYGGRYAKTTVDRITQKRLRVKFRRAEFERQSGKPLSNDSFTLLPFTEPYIGAYLAYQSALQQRHEANRAEEEKHKVERQRRARSAADFISDRPEDELLELLSEQILNDVFDELKQKGKVT